MIFKKIVSTCYCNLRKYYYDCLKDERNFKEIVNKKYRKFFKEESSKDRLYIKLKVYLPFVANLYDKMRK